MFWKEYQAFRCSKGKGLPLNSCSSVIGAVTRIKVNIQNIQSDTVPSRSLSRIQWAVIKWNRFISAAVVKLWAAVLLLCAHYKHWGSGVSMCARTLRKHTPHWPLIQKGRGNSVIQRQIWVTGTEEHQRGNTECRRARKSLGKEWWRRDSDC